MGCKCSFMLTFNLALWKKGERIQQGYLLKFCMEERAMDESLRVTFRLMRNMKTYEGQEVGKWNITVAFRREIRTECSLFVDFRQSNQ